MEFENLLTNLIYIFTCIISIGLFIKNKNIFYKFYILGIMFTYLVPFALGEFILNDSKYLNQVYYIKIFCLFILLISNIIIYIIMQYKKGFSNNLNRRFKRKLNHKVSNILFIAGNIYTVFLGWYSIYLLSVNKLVLTNNDVLRNLVTPHINKVTFNGALLGVSLIITSIYLILYLDKKKNIISFLYYFILNFCIVFTQGQRTSLIITLMTLFLIYMFKQRGNRSKQIKIGIIGGIVLVGILLYYSSNFKRILMNEENLLLSILGNDIDLNWTLWYSVEKMSLLSNDILPYPFAGFIYIITIFVPRSLWKGKGFSSAGWFTKEVISSEQSVAANISELNWGYKFGVLVDFILNNGAVGIVFYCIVIGLILRRLDIWCKDSILVKANIIMIMFYLTFNGVFNVIIYKLIPIIYAMLISNYYKESELNILDKNRNEEGKRQIE